MRNVSIVGIGQSEVGELWSRSVREIAYDAIAGAMDEAGTDTFTINANIPEVGYGTDFNKAAIEEMIRWAVPFTRMVRVATR